ncbi:MAG: hypothetical protein AB1429_16920 [Pseudomonadota bacterium]|jgi:hypothetical protein
MSNVTSMLKLTLAAGLAWSALAVGQASASLLGNWVNANPNPRDIAEVIVAPAAGAKVDVRVFGECTPTACDWGVAVGPTFASSVGGNPVAGAVAATAHYQQGFARRQVVLQQINPNLLHYDVFTEFEDGSGRSNYVMSGTLRRAPRLLHLAPRP